MVSQPTDLSQEVQWVLRAQSGDRDALDCLLQMIQQPLYRYLCGIVQDEDLALDTLQEVFLLIVRKLYWLREPKVFRAWAYRIASRQAFRNLKKKQRWARIHGTADLLGQVPGPVEMQRVESQWLDRLPDLIAKLSPASRAVMTLHYVNGVTLQEVADILNISIGTVKSRLAYGLQTLRQQMNPKADGD